MTTFDYDLAFSRNHGITSDNQQNQLKNATVAIAGMGGVGGDYLITLARCGIGNFKISDFDEFEVANFNRQYGAMISTVGQPKMDVMENFALDINPEMRIETFDNGINESNVNDFLDKVDVFVDAVEFFEIDAHRLLINACMEKGIPAVFGVPLGYGVGMLIYTKDGMTFDDYFDLENEPTDELKVLKMSLGCAPAGFHLNYVDPSTVDLSQRKAPSIACGCKLATGMIICQTIQAILEPSKLKPIPHYTCYDAKLNRLKKGYLWRGNQNPIQKLKYKIAKKLLNL